MPLSLTQIRLLPVGTPTIDQVLPIQDTVSGLTVKVTVGQILAMFSIPANIMTTTIYDTNGNGVVDDSEELNGQPGLYYLARANHTGVQTISTITGLQAALDAKLDDSQAGVAGGLATLDGTGKLPLSQLPFTLLDYVGTWDANTNTPALSDATGTLKEAYLVVVAGTQNLGSGAITFAQGDAVAHNGSIWQKVPGAASPGVVSITTQVLAAATGAISLLDVSHFNEVAGKRFMTDAENDAFAAANAPSGANPVATINDLTAVSVVGSYPPSPDDVPDPIVAPVHANQTFAGAGITQPQIDAAYGAGFALTTDNIDWAAVQYRFNQSCANGTPMSLVGDYYMGSKNVTLPKIITSNKLTVYGYSNRLIFAGGTGLTRVRPANITENQQQQNTSMYFHHVRLIGSGAGTGFAPAANTNSVFEGLFIENFATAGICRTTQNANFQSIDIRDCYDGMIIRNEEALVGLEAQTASNGTRFWHPRYRHSADAGRAFQWFASYGGELYGAQIEGNGSMEYAVFYDSLNVTVAKKFAVIDPHFESTQAYRQAAMYFAMREGVVDLVSPEHDISTTMTGTGDNLLMVKATSYIVGTSPCPIINIMGINKWNPATNGTYPNKWFHNDRCRWNINLWSSEIPTAAFWAGTAVTEVSKLSNQPGNTFAFF